MVQDEARVNWKIWQDPEVAARFTDRRRGGLLGGAVQLETMLRLLTAVPEVDGPLRVLDLGCGDGVLLEAVFTAFPATVGVALDGAPVMLERAQDRLKGRNVFFLEADFNQPEWREGLPEGQYHAVVSGFAIHHSEDQRKRELYSEIYDLLEPGGLFVNIEHVASASSLGEQFFEEAWVENAVRFRREQGEAVEYQVALEETRSRADRAANRLTTVDTQLTWLREIGFVDVDCYWKHFELAVLAGYRSGPGKTVSAVPQGRHDN